MFGPTLYQLAISEVLTTELPRKNVVNAKGQRFQQFTRGGSGANNLHHACRDSLCQKPSFCIQVFHVCTKMVTTCASTSSNPTRARTPGALERSNSPGSPSASHSKRPAMASFAGVFPFLDYETTRIVLSCLPPACLGQRSEVQHWNQVREAHP